MTQREFVFFPKHPAILLVYSYDKYCLRESGFIPYYSDIFKPDNGFLVILINTHTNEHKHTTPCLANEISICCVLEVCKLGFQKEYFKSGLCLPQCLPGNLNSMGVLANL